MAKIYRINCPDCGGLISSRGERVVECRYCHSRSLVLIPDWIPSFYLKPALDFNQARRALIALFRREEVIEGLLQNARFESAELFFMPFYLFQGKRIGVFTSLGQPKTQNTLILESYDNWKLNYRELVKKQRFLAQTQTDSRVIFNDVARTIPGVKLEDWGLESFDPAKVIIENNLELNQYRRDEMEKLGIIIPPRVNPTEQLQHIFYTPELAMVQDQTKLMEQRVELVYYPLWRVCWKYQGRAYQATLDGILGKIIFARAPAKEQARMAWLLGVSAITGLSLGQLLKIAKLLILTGAFSFWLVLLFSTALLFFLAFGWNMFRYSKELVINGENTSIEFIGRPAETIFDKMAMAMSKFLEQGFKRAQRKKELYPWI